MIILRIGAVLLGMAGLRLDKREKTLGYAAWVVAFFAAMAFYFYLSQRGISREGATIYAVVIWVLYYVGNSVALASPLRRKMIETLGEKNALRTYNAVLGLIFAQQGAAQGLFMDAYKGTLGGPTGLVLPVAVALIVVGLTTKIWATYVSGLNTYYYNDMFLGRPTGEIKSAVVTGPYRWFRNPMYGVGNLQAYGSALVADSLEGLILCGIFQASIYIFNYLFEKPFVMETYFKRPATAPI